MGLRESGQYVAAYIQEALPVTDDEFAIEQEGDRYDIFYTGGDGDYQQHVGMADSWRGAVREKELLKQLDSWELDAFLDGSYDPDTATDDAIAPAHTGRKEI